MTGASKLSARSRNSSRRPARSPLCSPALPPALGELPMPTKEGVRGDEKAPPTRPRERATQRSEDRSIGGSVPDTSVDLTFEDSDLVPEHHDLDVLVRFGPTARDNKAEQPAHPEIEEGEDHGG